MRLAGIMTAECPCCQKLVSKNAEEECDHIACTCGHDFCFSCSAKREPILIHGNHYHRPDCKHFSNFEDSDLEPHPKCSECKNLGTRCPRP